MAIPAHAAGATINVTTTADQVTTNGACSLREAILYANGTAETDCSATAAAPGTTTTINVPAGAYTLTGAS